MALRHAVRVGSILGILFFALFILAGSQRSAFADVADRTDGLAGRIICHVFTDLNEIGQPIPHVDSGVCSDSPSPPPPPPAPAPACSNDTDDDGDGFIDELDPNCHTDGNPTNTASYDANRAESGALPACWNGIDDDGDGKIDSSNDPGCSSPTDTSEADSGAPAQCSNDTDDDGDGIKDSADPGCHTDFNAGNSASYDPDLNNEAAIAPPSPQCSDGLDNDSDGHTDAADPGCHSDFNADNTVSYTPSGTDESAAPPQCSDGLDNDGDGKVDSADPGCSNANDTDETDPAPSGGANPGAGGTPAPSGGGGPPVGSIGGSSGGSGSAGGGLVLGAATTSASAYSPDEIAACDTYLTAFIREGSENNAEQVKRLQKFLRDFEHASVKETGIYDNATLTAVHAFQTKYASAILTPWGISKSTGFVYLTTRKKVNEIFCKNTKTFLLTPEELKKIEEARARNADVRLTPASPAEPISPKAPAHPKDPTQSRIGIPTMPTTTTNIDLGGVLRFFRGIFDRAR